MAHDFSDDDFDDLPLNTLDELESNAIQFTQQQKIHEISSDYGNDLDDEAFEDAAVVDITNKHLISTIQPPKVVGPTPTAHEHFRLSRYTSSNQSQPMSVPSLASASRTETNGSGRITRGEQSIRRNEHVQTAPVPKGDDGGVDQLRKQIEELMKERDQLKQQLTAKSGEIAIVRTNQEKETKEHERQLNTLKRLNAEELERQKKATDIARDAERTAATELEFAKRDLAEEGERIRNLRRARDKDKDKDKDKAGLSHLGTPKKNKSLPHGDGFDDDEIQIISPSKWQPKKSNPSTPTKTGNKRKRKGVESPMAALDFVQGPNAAEQVQSQSFVSHIDLALLEKLSKDDHRLDFLQSILSHRPHRNHLRTIEAFGKHFFPSNPNESFSSIILDKLPTLQAKDTTNFSIEFCEIITSLWSKCLIEKYYTPLFLLVDLLTFALELRTLPTAPFVVDTLLPVIQDTICLLAVPRFKREPPPSFSKEIDMTGCLTLLHLVALGCLGDREHIFRFWRFMRLEFVLMILSNLQTLEDLEIMLPIMSTGALSNSIGPIAADAETQKKQAEYILDRVTYLLFEKPAASEGKQPHDRSGLLHLRLQLLGLLDAICRTSYGAEAMTAHPLAIGRLAKLMSDELDILYDYQAGHKESAMIVCFSNRLLHHLVTKYEKLINIQKKLQPIHGGVHKYLTSLARLAFNEEDLVYGAGIDPEVSLCAREMLEALVTPEEGEAIYEAFASP